MDSETEIRQREQQTDTPTLADDDQGDAPEPVDDGDDQGGSVLDGLPVPSLSRTQFAIIGAIVAAIVIWKLYQSNQGESLVDAVQHDFSSEVEIEGDDEEQEIVVPTNTGDPLAGDAAVAEAFRKNGRLTEAE